MSLLNLIKTHLRIIKLMGIDIGCRRIIEISPLIQRSKNNFGIKLNF
jgi:hypothetical protein